MFKRTLDYPLDTSLKGEALKKEEAKKKQKAEQILAKIYFYTNTDNPSDLYLLIGQDSSLQNLIYQIQTAAANIPNDEKIKSIEKILMRKTTLETKKDVLKKQLTPPESAALKVYDTIYSKVEELKKNKVTIDSIHSAAKPIDVRYYLTNDNKIDSLDIIHKAPIKDTFFLNLTEYNNLIKKSDSINTLLNSRFIQVFDSLAFRGDSLVKDIFIKAGFDENFASNVKFGNARLENTLTDIQTNNYAINLADGNSSGSIAGWKMPSEAEMIDAVATYIASRVKQETVLWFFEEMRINTERYELLNTAFPETVKLLKTGEIFEAPNMGSAWKYALSEDFVKLPEHIINSNWLDERLPEDKDDELELLKVAGDISHMVNNRLSYDDIIKQLYMKNCLTDTANKPKILRNSISFLYAVSTELSVLTKEKTLRKITFEELQAMPLEQMRILLALLNMKYQNCIRNQYEEISNKPLTKEQKQEISVWIGNSLMALDQFDKILKQVKEGAQDNNQMSLFDGYNTWKLISDAMLSAFPDPDNEKIKYSLDRMDDAFEVYHLMTEKNYAGAVVKTLQLVDSLLYSDKLGVFIKDYDTKTPFIIPISMSSNKKDCYVDLMELDNFFLERRAKSNKFPMVARKIELSTICIADIDISKVDTLNQQIFLSISPNDLKLALLNANAENLDKYENKLTNLFNDINNSQLDTIVRNFGEWGGTLKGDSVYFAINSVVAQALISQDKKAMQVIKKLASFLNDVALADGEKELKKVVESYALPPGSYKQKRNAWQSFSLNAFAGPYVGYETSTPFGIREKIENPDGTVTRPMSEFGWNYGISVPIGLTYSKTIGKRTYANSRLSQNYRYNQDLIKIGRKNLYVRSKWNFSLTLSIVDIGAVVCYRMSNADSVLNQSFKWEQFISPGLHLGIALPRTPLVFQIGYQYTPQIRRIDVGGGATKELGMWRAYAGLYFDIPMFNMWIKTRSVHFE